MKEYTILFIVVMVAVFIGGVILQSVNKPESTPEVTLSKDVINLGSMTGETSNFVGSSAANYFIATSTATTTSNSIYLGYETRQLDLTLHVKASSTTSQLRWQYEFSNDGTNWFGEDTKSTSDNIVTHQPATTTHYWTPGITEPAKKNIGVVDVATRFLRIKFFRGNNSSTAGNNLSMWLEGSKAIEL